MPRQFSKIPAAVVHATPAICGLEALVAEAQNGNTAARDKVIKAFVPWIAKVARKYAHRAGRYDLLDDMKQAAICGNSSTSLGGLMRAIQDYKPGTAAFYRYAIIWINKAFQDIMSTGVAGSTRRTFELTNRIRTMAKDIEAGFGREVTPEDIRRAASDKLIAEMGDDEIWDALSTATFDSHKSPNPDPAHDIIKYDASVQPATQEADADSKQSIEQLGTILAKAKPRHRAMFLAVYEDGLTQEEVAEQFGVTKTAVAYVVNKLRAKVKKKIKR